MGMGKRSRMADEMIQFQFLSSKMGHVRQPAHPQAEVTLAIPYLRTQDAGKGRLSANLVIIHRRLTAFFRHIIGLESAKPYASPHPVRGHSNLLLKEA